MLQTITLDDMRFRCIVGIRPLERTRRQPVLVDVALDVELPDPGPLMPRELAIEQTVDYSALYGKLRAAVEGSSFGLVESLVALVADTCMDDPRVARVAVRVRKPRALRGKATVGVAMVRSRSRDGGGSAEGGGRHGTSGR